MLEFLCDGAVVLHQDDCLAALARMPNNSVDSIVTDPPYHLTSIVKRFGSANAAPAQFGTDGAFARASKGFMGKQWDGGDIAFRVELWAEVLRVLKPGGFLAAFSGTRTYHRMACAIEDAGFEIRDQLAWVYGQGFPKSLDISKAIDKHLGAERKIVSEGAAVKRMIPGADQNKHGWEKNNGRVYIPTETAAGSPEAAEWSGWGTALKPAWEPICFARKPLAGGTVAANVLVHGTGAINIDGCRIEGVGNPTVGTAIPSTLGRWPANLVHDGSPEVLAGFPDAKGAVSNGRSGVNEIYGKFGAQPQRPGFGDSGSAARFFYCAKASAKDRIGSKHPTVKPVALMQWLVRLVTPPGGVVLDPFAGTGTTGAAAILEGFRAILIEREEEYGTDIKRRFGKDASEKTAAE